MTNHVQNGRCFLEEVRVLHLIVFCITVQSYLQLIYIYIFIIIYNNEHVPVHRRK